MAEAGSSGLEAKPNVYEHHLKKLHDVCLAKLLVASKAQKEAKSRSQSAAKKRDRNLRAVKQGKTIQLNQILGSGRINESLNTVQKISGDKAVK